MPYISADGEMTSSRSMWRLTLIPDLFWGTINFITLLFKTMWNPHLTSKGTGYESNYRSSGRGPDPFGPGGGGPRRRMGGFRGGPGGPSAPPMAGGG